VKSAECTIHATKEFLCSLTETAWECPVMRALCSHQS